MTAVVSAWACAGCTEEMQEWKLNKYMYLCPECLKESGMFAHKKESDQ